MSGQQRSVHGSCTVDENGQCDECGAQWPVEPNPVDVERVWARMEELGMSTKRSSE